MVEAHVVALPRRRPRVHDDLRIAATPSKSMAAAAVCKRHHRYYVVTTTACCCCYAPAAARPGRRATGRRGPVATQGSACAPLASSPPAFLRSSYSRGHRVTPSFAHHSFVDFCTSYCSRLSAGVVKKRGRVKRLRQVEMLLRYYRGHTQRGCR